MNPSHEMDEFVNWDNAGAALGSTFDQDTEHIGLVLENVSEDDFSFCALEHFSNGPGLDFQPPAEHLSNCEGDPWFESLAYPCGHCALGGYSCKRICEGQFKGFCTSCVALGVSCSFGLSGQDALDPNTFSDPFKSPWSTVGLVQETPATSTIIDIAPVLDASSNTLDVPSRSSSAQDDAISSQLQVTPAPSKIGARFSRDSVRILKTWLSTHHRHPYPSEEEKEMLQRTTGLNKTQITNWLANARRRGKVQPPRSTSPHHRNWSNSIDIPQRRGTPALEAMNPLQRWAHSPPEHEPASVTAIARAVTASSSAISSGLNSPFSLNYTDDGSSKSLYNQSSASSLGTSQSSNGSHTSAYSHGSRNSFGSAPFNSRGRRRRRRRATPLKETSTSLAGPLKTFQCTFCTETFRTKHDWQRHEKSLHLSLERWVCAPHGPRAVDPDNGQLCCVFCGLAEPDDKHIETHNHSSCQERTLEERTFYRKDHLNQHLRLVHNGKFLNNFMKLWKVASAEIRSRCGFCGIVMDTWTIRVDHLAEHFKTGYSMADWKGDWGFDISVLDMVENSIPPYLIHHERNSPLPYVALQAPPESPRNAWGLIKLELAYFTANYREQHGRPPSDDELILEGCRIIFASELLSLQGIATQVSWLRDIIMNSKEAAQRARFGPLRGAAENRLQILKINGKDNLFEQCPMEFQLHQYVKAKSLLGLTPMDDELQEEACRIVGRIEEMCTHPSDEIANWLLRCINQSTSWLASFRRRAHLPRSEDVKSETIRSRDPTLIDSTIHSYSRLESELGIFYRQQCVLGKEPTDEDLQKQARIIIFEFDDGWNQTAADNRQWLDSFRERQIVGHSSTPDPLPAVSSEQKTSLVWLNGDGLAVDGTGCSPRKVDVDTLSSTLNNHAQSTINPSFLNDANCYRRLARELKRWIAATMSPNNPNKHLPTDDELRYQARWILYDDDDPWNQTAADNVEWLERLKRDAGIGVDDGPGLPDGNAWAIEQGGSGFAPPYAYPQGHVERCNDDIRVGMGQGAKQFTAGRMAVNRFLNTLKSPKSRPPNVFCSRELENGLAQFAAVFATEHGHLPTDSELQQKGREILGASTTAAEETRLLERFKELVQVKLLSIVGQQQQQQEVPVVETSVLPPEMDLNFADADFGDMLKSMDVELDTSFMNASATFDSNDEIEGGVSLTLV